MIDVDAVRAEVERVVTANGGQVLTVGVSELSDAIYINIRKPKEVLREYGVLDSWAVLVRVSNHFNDTNTHERLTTDLFINICDADLVGQAIDELTDYLIKAECVADPEDSPQPGF